MPPVTAKNTGRAYWRSLDELADSPQFRQLIENEFPGYAPQMITGPSRRSFLKIMAASVALAGLTGCRRWPRRQLAPYASRPESAVPGQTEQFATAMELGGVARPVLVTSFDGRPIKVEGNPQHPASNGAADALTQASILNLYDPHRAQHVRQGRADQARRSSWQAFAAFWADQRRKLEADGGRGLVILGEATDSPTIHRLRTGPLATTFPQARWLRHEPVNRDNELRGTEQVFGRALRPVHQLDRASVIVSLDSDFLISHPDAVRLAGQFAAGRRRADDEHRMNRLYVAEPLMTLTGAAADIRHATTSKQIQALAGQIYNALVHQAEPTDPFARQVVADLKRHRGRAVVLAGADQPAAVHAVAHRINRWLGGESMVSYLEPAHVDLSVDTLPDSIDTLVIIGGNPAYTGSFDINANTIIRLGDNDDETSRLADWSLPRAHYLEAWSDSRAWDGTVTIGQPLIEPLFEGRSAIELLAMLVGQKPDGYQLVRQTQNAAANEKAWRKALHDGLVPGSGYQTASVQARPSGPVDAADETAGDMELLVRPDYSVFDGRFANNGWLQETPDPITKITWDNAACVSPVDAKRLEVSHGDVVELTSGSNTVALPVYVVPGQATGTIGAAMGYGRSAAGPVGNAVGGNVMAMRRAQRVKLTRTHRTHRLATTQDHHAIDLIGIAERQQRAFGALIREGTIDEYAHDPEHFAHKIQHMWVHYPTQPAGKDGDVSLPVQPFEQPLDFDEAADYQWAMAIDLNTCIGCNACMVACQAENNVPIVGPDEVANGREMHWIRIDRYFTGPTDSRGIPQVDDPDQVELAHQPVACQHCENAPCETVCPVAATVHDSEGLNVMVYNRCIGTRYCSNNCPYKVRRFNYFDYHVKPPHESAQPFLGMPDQQQHQVGEIQRMQFNPDVTVRMRGVMEKCTFCTQRIEAARARAKVEDRPVGDGEVTPACAATCPTQAIVFGNVADPDSRVAKLIGAKKANPRAYGILTELNTRPRLKYLARLKNPGNRTPHGHQPGHDQNTDHQRRTSDNNHGPSEH
jgi:molybdopterin-containing oxidoreductase family iron-sulfur binding subunit